MTNQKLWQSWSHAKKNPLSIPIWDKCPVAEITPENPRPPKFRHKPPITGWCSWHGYGKNISHNLIINQAKKAQGKNLEYILIDDGWCLWGDWCSPDKQKFPQGIKPVSLHLAKYHHQKTGLWLAPFLIDPKSDIYQKHPNWIIRNKFGKPVNGWQFSPLSALFGFKKYVLDYEISAVQKYLQTTIKTMIFDWKISLLKLDFLYAPYFNPKYKTDEKPHQILVDLFKFIKSNFPDTFIIACGCPFKPAKYMVDAIRINPDINAPALHRLPLIGKLIYKNRFKHLVANWQANRHLRKFFHLDPDAIMYNQSHSIYDQSAIKFFGDVFK